MKSKYLLVLPLISLLTIGCNKNNVPSNVEFTPHEMNSTEFHTETQLNIFINNLDAVILDTTYTYLEPYSVELERKEDLTRPNPIHFSWDSEAKGGSVASYKLSISESEDMSNPLEYKTKAKELDVYNLKTSTDYYWTVSAYKFTSDVQHFKTTDTMIRNLYVDGVRNVRDIGGTALSSVKQGLIYRGGAFEKYNRTYKKIETNITKDGIKAIKQLGIKTEIDLRRNDEDKENCELTKSTVDGLNYVNLPMQYHNQNILTYTPGAYGDYDNPARIKDFFEILADRNNYPVYMHCSQGKDRTGCLAYLVESLLGANQNELYADYLFSSLSGSDNKVNVSGITTQYGRTLDNYGTESMTLSEKVYAYLNVVVGISTQTLDSVISILEK